MITAEELLELGCPGGLVIQYLLSYTRGQILEMNYAAEMQMLVEAME